MERQRVFYSITTVLLKSGCEPMAPGSVAVLAAPMLKEDLVKGFNSIMFPVKLGEACLVSFLRIQVWSKDVPLHGIEIGWSCHSL